MDEARMEKIESQLTFQEDLLDELNKTVYQQQQKIEQLEAICAALASQLRAMADSTGGGQGSANEKPPHY